jgi:MFS-type transporter involved in bile tolerance (Atg22 family)
MPDVEDEDRNRRRGLEAWLTTATSVLASVLGAVIALVSLDEAVGTTAIVAIGVVVLAIAAIAALLSRSR